MSCHPKCPTQRVVDPPQVVYNDVYHPQIVEVIHQVEVVNRHHCVPVPCHIVTYTYRDEFCPSPLERPVQINSKRKTKKAGKR